MFIFSAKYSLGTCIDGRCYTHHILFLVTFWFFTHFLSILHQLLEAISEQSSIEYDYVIISSDKCKFKKIRPHTAIRYVSHSQASIQQILSFQTNSLTQRQNKKKRKMNAEKHKTVWCSKNFKEIGWTNPNDIQLDMTNFSE